MERYTVTIKKNTTATALIGYEDGVCVLVQITTQGLKPEQAGWILKTIPPFEGDLPTLELALPFIRVEAVPADLTFNAFWEAYGYKVGKRERAIKIWATLNDIDKARCIRSIPKYNQWLSNKFNMERLYPETYLSQRRWENEFKI